MIKTVSFDAYSNLVPTIIHQLHTLLIVFIEISRNLKSSIERSRKASEDQNHSSVTYKF